ncbi:MAG: hypothetical protein J6X11_00235 [Treponema sp.]|nr:hypothetical protein [Treponema sp.]MBP5746769.1 hypothetical protein [Treponema sp.]MBR4386449.1 hypothetical protein [Treponema sp.]
MKKAFFAVMAALAMMVCFVGCKKKVSPLVGTYTIDSVDGMSVADLKQLEEVTGTKVEGILNLNADGSGDMSIMGMKCNLKWDESSKTMTLSDPDGSGEESKVSFKVSEDGKLSLTEDGSEMVFAKQK